jgi:hypothetical protein
MKLGLTDRLDLAKFGIRDWSQLSKEQVPAFLSALLSSFRCLLQKTAFLI